MRELAPLLQGRHAHACGVYHLGEVQVKYEISRWGPADIWLNINIPWSSFKCDCPDADCSWWHSCGEQAEKHRGVNFFSFAGTRVVCHHLWLWLSPSSPLPQLIKGTELLWWREGLLEVRQLFRSKAWTYETFREFWRRIITYQVSGWAARAKVLLQRSNCGWSLWIWRSRESGNKLRLSDAGTLCKRNIAWFL